MADYPAGIYSPRVKENKPSVVYDAAKKTVVFVEDITKLDDEVVAIETELGANPKGLWASVAENLSELWAAIAGFATSFLDLSDTPASYEGQAGKVVAVNGAENALEFVSVEAGLPTIKVSTIFESSGRFGLTVGGSGTTVFNTSGMNLSTVATSGSYAKLTEYIGGYPYLFAGSPIFSIFIRCTYLDLANGVGHFFAGLGDPTVAGSGITFTVRHIGFKIIKTGGVATLYATQADGTTENVSDPLTTLSEDNFLTLILKINGTDSVDYYWRKNNGALSAPTNLTANLPTLNENRMTVAASNVDTAYDFDFALTAMNYER